MFNLFLVIYFLLFLGLALKNIRWAVFLTLFTLPAYLVRFDLGSIPMTVLEGEILILFLGWLIKNFRKFNFGLVKQFTQENKLLVIGTGLFLLAATISVFAAPEIRAAAGIWKAYFIEPVLFLIVFSSVIRREDLKKIAYVLVGQVLILSLFGIYQKITGSFISNPFWAEEVTRRITSFYPYPNALALYLAPILIILIGYLFRLQKKDWVKVLIISLIIILGLLAVYFTKSKGAILALLVGIFFYALFYKNYRKYFIIISILILIGGGVLFGAGKINLHGTATVEGGDSITTRLEMWSEAWQMLQSKPILGAGLSGYQINVQEYHEKDYIEIYMYPHNIFLTMWSELGILGLISFIIILFWFFIKGFKNRNIIILAAMVVLLTHGMVDVPYFKNDLSILFWFLIGFLLILNKEQEDSSVV